MVALVAVVNVALFMLRAGHPAVAIGSILAIVAVVVLVAAFRRPSNG